MSLDLVQQVYTALDYIRSCTVAVSCSGLYIILYVQLFWVVYNPVQPVFTVLGYV